MLSYSVLRRINQVSKTYIRYKNPPHHWSVLRKKVHPIDKALAHFDDFYKQVFDKKWESIREGLLGKQKYVAVVNNYGDNEKTISKLEMSGALNIRTLFNLEKEYLQEQLNKQKREDKLIKIYQMDKEMEESAVETKDTNVEKTDASKFSLQSSLDKAEIEYSRIIDPENVLSTELLQEFVPATKLKGREDFITESSHYKMFDSTASFNAKIEKEYDIHFPEQLNVYCYEIHNNSDFESSAKACTGVLNYYLMDGGSILPVLALDLKPGCRVLDMCASPGGKSLLTIQTLYPDYVVSNDSSKSRVDRLESVYKQFLYDFNERWLQTGRVRLTNFDARFVVEDDFDRILVDVPCTNDRHSLKENDNNIFKPSRIKERLQLPKLQSEMLFNALKLVSVGGVVVYSTCSLSPIQNDGVVYMTLRKIWEETNIEIVIKDLNPALSQSQRVYQMADPKLLRCGHLVLPCKGQNYGPTYFCKLQRIK